MATPKFCRICGTRLPSDSAFCSSCGTSTAVEGDKPTVSSPLTPPELPPTVLPYQHYQGPGVLLPQQAPNMGTGRLPTAHMLHQRYRLLHTVGQGGMGAVYVAQDTQLGDRLVAVKEMSMSRLTPQEVALAVEQFRREAHLLASLNHPNLPVIHEYFSEKDRWYLVMSFIEGQNLQTVLNSTPGNKLPVNEVVRLGIELCEVLEYLHMHNPQIIFRDLKPLNIMLTPKGHICLIDFGIARHFKQEQTKDTSYYYSVGYAPPEQYGQAQTGPRSDIYSLGATLHQMLSGHNPASKPFQFANLQMVDPTIPVPLAKLIAQMLEMNETARPASIAEVKVQLEKTLKPDPIVDKAIPEHQKNITPGSKKLERSTFFSSKPWMIIRTCLLVISLIAGLALGIPILSGGYGYEVTGNGVFVLIGGVAAAIIGFFMIFMKGRILSTSIGGVLIAILGELTLLSLQSGYVARHASLYMIFIPILNLLLLAVGSVFFFQRANRGGVVFSTLLIVLGIGLAILTWHVFQGHYYSYYDDCYYYDYTSNSCTGGDYVYFYYRNTQIYNIFFWMWIPSAIVGIAGIIISRRKSRATSI